jgi:hypothetical protein
LSITNATRFWEGGGHDSRDWLCLHLCQRVSFRRGVCLEKDVAMKKFSPTERLAQIRFLIESVEQRCMAVDGPVTPAKEEITNQELRRIYRLASLPREKGAA